MEDKYKKYAELSKQIKLLESERDEMKDELLGDLTVRGNTLKTDFGTFSTVERRTFKYSEIVKSEELKVKELKKKEEESGEAEVTVSKSLRFQ